MGLDLGRSPGFVSYVRLVPSGGFVRGIFSPVFTPLGRGAPTELPPTRTEPALRTTTEASVAHLRATDRTGQNLGQNVLPDAPTRRRPLHPEAPHRGRRKGRALEPNPSFPTSEELLLLLPEDYGKGDSRSPDEAEGESESEISPSPRGLGGKPGFAPSASSGRGRGRAKDWSAAPHRGGAARLERRRPCSASWFDLPRSGIVPPHPTVTQRP